MPWEWERRTGKVLFGTWGEDLEGPLVRHGRCRRQGSVLGAFRKVLGKDLWLDLNSSQQLFSDWKPSVLAFLDISSVEYFVQLF